MGRNGKKVWNGMKTYGPEAVDIVATIAAGVLGADDATAGIGTLTNTCKEGYNTLRAEITEGCDMVWGVPIIPNPLFVQNGHTGKSPKTRKYVRNRFLKNVGGGVVSLVGTAGSVVTQVNTTGAARHATAVASSALHLARIESAGKGLERSVTVRMWLDHFIKMKAWKLGVRGGQLASDLIPFAPASAVMGVGSAVVKIAVKRSMGELTAGVAMHVHWRARQEAGIGGRWKHGGARGPAMKLMHEMFHNVTPGHDYDVGAFIHEPAGWVALNDKLMLI